MSQYIIETENLTKNFGRFKAVDHINLKISRNKIQGFIGPNGAGKTTTIKMLTGAIHPTQGHGHINGYKMGSKNGKALIGYAPAESLFYSDMTTIEYLVYIGKIKGLKQSDAVNKACELIQYFGLEEATHRKPIHFSSGMKKKIIVSQALINDPKVLILDEPTANLDPTARIQILDILQKLMIERDISIFISSHILSELESLVNEVTLFNKGKIVLSGSLNEVKQKYSKGIYKVRTSDNNLFVDKLMEHCKVLIKKITIDPSGDLLITIIPKGKEKFELIIGPIISHYKISLIKFIQEDVSLDEIYKDIYK
ncbi:MAG: transporter [Haloplasmataceae bacterium]|nr:transporter [Haloplasmataceae bacterium]